MLSLCRRGISRPNAPTALTAMVAPSVRFRASSLLLQMSEYRCEVLLHFHVSARQRPEKRHRHEGLGGLFLHRYCGPYSS